MTSSQRRRMWIVIVSLCFMTLVVIGRLVAFQVVQADELVNLPVNVQTLSVVARPDRGVIYDRNGAVLAGNSSDYQVGVSPSLVVEAEEMATALAPILQIERFDILGALEANRPYALLAGRVSPDVADTLRQLSYSGLQIDPLPRRIYPQGELACHLLGYTDFAGVGGSGVEGYYQRELAGEAASATVNISPLMVQQSVIAREGSDLVLTLDRTVQRTTEQYLRQALAEYGAVSGTILVMSPRTGAILAMANHPCYDPFRFFEADERRLLNPAVSQQFEPGSIMKLITMASALDSGTVTPQTVYHDSGVIQLGGHTMYNWDRSANGPTDMTTLLARSLNVGAATIASWMGADSFYTYLGRFGFGRPTGVDLMAEAAGQLPLPGDANWTETNIGTNSFGQGLAVTPLQMISAVAAIANDGYLMQPYVVQEIHSGDRVYVHEPTAMSRPISEHTAHQLSAMAVTAVRQEIVGAQLQGYTVAGKTGTAQIAENGIYLTDATIGAFIGWFPADNPEIIVLVKLDRPTVSPWGSTTAAPTFAGLAAELAVLLDIPPDEVRLRADVMAARDN